MQLGHVLVHSTVGQPCERLWMCLISKRLFLVISQQSSHSLRSDGEWRWRWRGGGGGVGGGEV